MPGSPFWDIFRMEYLYSIDHLRQPLSDRSRNPLAASPRPGNESFIVVPSSSMGLTSRDLRDVTASNSAKQILDDTALARFRAPIR